MSDYYILLQVFLSTLSFISVTCQICVIHSSTCQKNIRTLMFSFSILSNFLHVLVVGFFVTQKTDIPHIILAVLLTASTPVAAQLKTENIVIVTLDGMRWQEVFGGADAAILTNKKYTKDSSGTSKDFWTADAIERRKKFLPAPEKSQVNFFLERPEIPKYLNEVAHFKFPDQELYLDMRLCVEDQTSHAYF